MHANGEHQSPRIGALLRVPPPEGTVIARWHPGPGDRIMAMVFLAIFVGISLLLLIGGAELSDHVGGGVMLVAAPIGLWLVFGRPYLVLTDRQVVVQNALVGFVVPLGAIKGAGSGAWGVVLDVRGRSSPITAMAVPKANISFMLGRKVRGDRVAAQIVSASQESSSDED